MYNFVLGEDVIPLNQQKPNYLNREMGNTQKSEHFPKSLKKCN